MNESGRVSNPSEALARWLDLLLGTLQTAPDPDPPLDRAIDVAWGRISRAKSRNGASRR